MRGALSMQALRSNAPLVDDRVVARRTGIAALRERSIIATARAATSHHGHTFGEDDREEEEDATMSRRERVKTSNISLVELLKEAREKGESKRALISSVSSASRAELEYMVQMNERDILGRTAQARELMQQCERYRTQVEKLNQLLEIHKADAQLDHAEILKLRTFKEGAEKAKAQPAGLAPSDEAWARLRSEEKRLQEREEKIEESLRLREAQLASGEADAQAKVESAKKREADAAARTEAAKKAMVAAEEATTAAEAAADDAHRSQHKYMHQAAIQAVAKDRSLTRRLRAEGSGLAWWEHLVIERTNSTEPKKWDAHSGMAMALDLDFLLSGLSTSIPGEISNSTSQLPELLRATAAGRAAEALVIHRSPRGEGWMSAFLSDVFADKLLHDQAAEHLGAPVVGLAPFFCHWAKARFGPASTVAINLWTLHQALVTHRPHSVEASTVLLFLEQPETPRLNRVLTFYLHCRAFIAKDAFNLNSGARRSGGGANSSPFSASSLDPLPPNIKISPRSHERPRSPGTPSRGAGGVWGGRNADLKLPSSCSTGFLDGRRAPNSSLRKEGSALAPTVEGQGAGNRSSASEGREMKSTVLLARACEAVQYLFRPAADHVRLALLREVQAAARPIRNDVPPPLRSLTPLEQHVVDVDQFLLFCITFYDLNTQIAHTIAKHGEQQARSRNARKRGGRLEGYPLAAASLAVLRRSQSLGLDTDVEAEQVPDSFKELDGGDRLPLGFSNALFDNKTTSQDEINGYSVLQRVGAMDHGLSPSTPPACTIPDELGSCQ